MTANVTANPHCMPYPGTDKKYCITSNIEAFTPSSGNFTILVIDRYGRVRYSITKSDCFCDADDRFYFTLENLRRGIYYAFFQGAYEDDDYAKQERVFTDIQKLVVVGYAGGRACRRANMTEGGSLCPCGRHAVTYTEVQTVSIDGSEYLADANGNYITTSDGSRVVFQHAGNNIVSNAGKVRMSMTGEEFKALIEGRSDDGQINTVPEVLDVMKGLDEDAELVVMTSQDVDSMMNRILGNDNN